MATYGEMILKHWLFMKAYPFARYAIDPVPCAPLDKPLHLARVALIITAGLHTPEQSGFDRAIKGGDTASSQRLSLC